MRKFAFLMLICLSVGAHAATSMFSIQSNVPTRLTLPAAEQVQTIEQVTGDGSLEAVPLEYADGTVTLSVTDEMLCTGKAIFVVNRPPGKDMSDRYAPKFHRVLIDDTKVIAANSSLSIPFQPATVHISVSDQSGITWRGLQIEANGKRVPKSDLAVDRRAMGKWWGITYNRPPDFTLKSLRVTAIDRSLLQNRARFSLNIDGALSIIKGAQFSGGKALELGSEKAFAGAQVTLAAGKYDVEVIGYGPDSGSDSLWMEVDGKRMSDAVHLPASKPGIASALVNIDAETLPSITIDKSGEHTLVFVLREAPAPVLDRVRILQDGREIAVFEGEAMIPAFPKP